MDEMMLGMLALVGGDLGPDPEALRSSPVGRSEDLGWVLRLPADLPSEDEVRAQAFLQAYAIGWEDHATHVHGLLAKEPGHG